MAPQYLTKLPARHMRSSSGHVLVVNHTNTITFGNKSFLHAVAEIWNGLHIDILYSNSLNTFKNSLKIALFEEYFRMNMRNGFSFRTF